MKKSALSGDHGPTHLGPLPSSRQGDFEHRLIRLQLARKGQTDLQHTNALSRRHQRAFNFKAPPLGNSDRVRQLNSDTREPSRSTGRIQRSKHSHQRC